MRLAHWLLPILVLIAATPAIAKPTFKVGAILPLSGRSADYGEAARNGIELARAENPERFKNIEFIYEDSLYDGKTTITTFHKLRTGQKVDLFFVWGHGPCEAVAPVAEMRKVPTLVVSGDYAVARNRKHVIRFFPIHERFGEAILGHLREKQYKRIGIVKTEIGFLNHVVDGIRKNLNSDESLELVDNFPLGETDFKTTITKLKVRDFDSVGVYLAENQVALFYLQAKSLGYLIPTFGSHSFNSKKSVIEAKGEMTGAVYPAIRVDDAFRERYIQGFNDDVQISFAANAYDFAMLIGGLFNESTEKNSSNEIVAKLKSADPFTGATGIVTYNDDTGVGDEFVSPIVLRVIE